MNDEPRLTLNVWMSIHLSIYFFFSYLSRMKTSADLNKSVKGEWCWENTDVCVDVHKIILPKMWLKDTGLSLDAESTRVKRPRRGAVPWRSPSPAYTKKRRNHSRTTPTDITKPTCDDTKHTHQNLLLCPLIQVNRFDPGNVDAKIPVDSCAADADEDS